MGLLAFSPAFCGGLIEAEYALRVVVMEKRFSPAFCGGLIEASECITAADSVEFVFPRILRGPH